MKNLKTLLVICSLMVFITGCSSSGLSTRHHESAVKTIKDSITIKPGGSYEECVELKPGQIFNYNYDASNFVNFNIHYHTESGVQYPASKKGRMMGQGMIDPTTHDYYTQEQEFYCLMWDNLNDEPIKVSFSCVLKNKQ